MVRNVILIAISIILAVLAFKVITGILAIVFKIASLALFVGVVYLIFTNIKKISGNDYPKIGP